ncbi:hypothetical protein ABT160_19690 [Streptomyces sp. NPDC001941]|uniref:hypothetical protein n=1 Tax=Streptomyces sp. NPDC001941 TaxID=3154659 RepID=UPI0033340430
MTVRAVRSVLATALAAAALAGCSQLGTGLRSEGPAPAASATQDTKGGSAGRSAPRPSGSLPALGARTAAQVPATAQQAVVVTGEAPDSARNTVQRYQRDPGGGWKPVGNPWQGHNALKGWTDHHVQGDLRSPIGVFALTDAGGRLADPGGKLPYDHNPHFVASGTGSQGEPLAGAFDYVVAINYNRKPGTTPLDWTRPLGAKRGGGIWFHVDHQGPTQACVSLEKPHMAELLRWLDPARHPVVVMGDASALGR